MNIVFDILMWIGLIYVIIMLFQFMQSKVNAQVEERRQSLGDDEDNITPSQVRKRTVYVDIKLENINGAWYGWTIQDGKEQFVAQGSTKDEAMTNCSKHMVNDERIYVIKYLTSD